MELRWQAYSEVASGWAWTGATYTESRMTATSFQSS